MRGVEGLLPLEVAFFTTHRTRLVGLAATNRLPAIYGIREMVEAGGLMSYSVHFPDLYRRAATYVDISKHVGRVNDESILVDEIVG
jgi:putative ABC transport system substrate-binding protein